MTREYKDNKENAVHEVNENIRNIVGEQAYTLITRDETAFKQLFNALPKAINDVKKYKYILNPKNQEIFEKYKQLIFKD